MILPENFLTGNDKGAAKPLMFLLAYYIMDIN